MPVLIEFDPSELLSGEENRLKRQAHCMKVKSCAPTWAYKVTLFQCAHQSDLDPRRHITYMAWNEKGERFGPYHESFSYQQEQQFIAMILGRPARSASSSSAMSSSSSRSSDSSVSPSTSSTGSLNVSDEVSPSAEESPSPGTDFLSHKDEGKPFQLVTRKRRKYSYSVNPSTR